MESLLDGAIAGLGMFIMTAVLGTLTFYFPQSRIAKMIANLIQDIKDEGIKFNGKITTEKKVKKK